MWEVRGATSHLLPIAAHGQLPIEWLTWLPGPMAGSKLESRFLLLWRVAQGPPLEREVKFHASRRWRADFAHMESRTLIEIEGGIFIPGGGRHSRGMGYAKDAEKYLEFPVSHAEAAVGMRERGARKKSRRTTGRPDLVDSFLSPTYPVLVLKTRARKREGNRETGLIAHNRLDAPSRVIVQSALKFREN